MPSTISRRRQFHRLGRKAIACVAVSHAALGQSALNQTIVASLVPTPMPLPLLTQIGAEAMNLVHSTVTQIPIWVNRTGRAFFKKRAFNAAQKEVLALGAQIPAQYAALVQIQCVPASAHGLTASENVVDSWDLRFRILVSNVAPFLIRPHEINAKLGVVATNGDGITNVPVTRKLAAPPLYPGRCCEEEFDLPVRWKPRHPIAEGTALQLAMSGQLRMLGPWQVEYQDLDFSLSVYAVLKHNPFNQSSR